MEGFRTSLVVLACHCGGKKLQLASKATFVNEPTSLSHLIKAFCFLLKNEKEKKEKQTCENL